MDETTSKKGFVLKRADVPCWTCKVKFFTEEQLSRHVRVEHDEKRRDPVAGPSFRYVEKTPRKRAERKKLPGHACRECEAYYKSVADGVARIQEISRHRALYERPKTPEHFWELDIPDTPECIRRGYVNPVVEKFPVGKRKNRYLD